VANGTRPEKPANEPASPGVCDRHGQVRTAIQELLSGTTLAVNHLSFLIDGVRR